MIRILICKCGAVIPNDNISWTNAVNDLGEDVCLITADCDSCGDELNTSGYMCIETLEDAISDLQFAIDENILD